MPRNAQPETQRAPSASTSRPALSIASLINPHGGKEEVSRSEGRGVRHANERGSREGEQSSNGRPGLGPVGADWQQGRKRERSPDTEEEDKPSKRYVKHLGSSPDHRSANRYPSIDLNSRHRSGAPSSRSIAPEGSYTHTPLHEDSPAALAAIRRRAPLPLHRAQDDTDDENASSSDPDDVSGPVGGPAALRPYQRNQLLQYMLRIRRMNLEVVAVEEKRFQRRVARTRKKVKRMFKQASAVGGAGMEVNGVDAGIGDMRNDGVREGPVEVVVQSVPVEPEIVDPEEMRKRQLMDLENVRHNIWMTIANRDMPKAHRLMAQSISIRAANLRKISFLAQRESRKHRLAPPNRTTKELSLRAKKATREMLMFWKRNEKEERELRKKAEKEAMERRRVEEEMREQKRQARKLNFLITQTELYSHFIGKKIEDRGKGAVEGGSDDRAENLEEIDFDEVDDAELERRARDSAQQALAKQMEATKAFDESARARRLEAETEGEAGGDVAMSESVDQMDFLNPSSMPAEAEIEQPKMLTCKLKAYQLKGLNWLGNLYEQGINGILADEMGLGKTVQSISLMAYLAETHNIWGPFLVISPASTLHNWQQEVARFTPQLKALPYWGNQQDRKVLRKFWNKKKLYSKDAPFHVLITSYQLIVSDEKHFGRIKWQYMILDEAQAIKSSTSARWKTLLGFDCRNRLLLTGTPIQNSMQELWALLHFIMPTLFDSHEEFSEWFSKDIESHAENKGTLNEEQLRRLHMILKPFMLRRIKKDVENELGDKVEVEVSCALTSRQRRMYAGLKGKIGVRELLEKVSSLRDGDSEGMDNLMNLVIQFRKVCNHPELFERADVVSPVFAISPEDVGISRSPGRKEEVWEVPYAARGGV
ncbi:putative DNA helicase ino80, partial [Rhizophlyctis rosea]